jgi:hypothetical protein
MSELSCVAFFAYTVPAAIELAVIILTTGTISLRNFSLNGRRVCLSQHPMNRVTTQIDSKSSKDRQKYKEMLLDAA